MVDVEQPAAEDVRAGLEALLRCPRCSSPVSLGAAEAECVNGHTFPVVGGVPVFVHDEELAADSQYGLQREYFDAEFARYGAYRLENWRASYLRRLAATDALGGAGRPLVDVGVGGSGYTVIEAARAGRPAIGCDLSLEGLLVARRLAEQEGVAARTLFVCCSAERLPLATAAFDVALAIAVIEHIPDAGAAIGELARVLSPGGRGWITVPHALTYIPPLLRPANRYHDRRLGHLRRYDAERLSAACEAAGLSVVDTQFTGHPVKVLQLAVGAIPSQRLRDRIWWWCERHDLRRVRRRRGSMQLSVALRRT